MTTRAQIRKAALALPGVEEGVGSGAVTFRVDGRAFASVTGDGWLRVSLPDEETDAVLADLPTAERLSRSGRVADLRVPLGAINGQTGNHLVLRAWLAHAPGRAAEAVEAAASAVPGEVGDLPKAVGAPATRALTAAGLTTLSRVATLTEAELGALHGVGPKAVRVLREALAERGLSLR